MPTVTTASIKPSGGDYTSINAWEAGEQKNLVTADEQHNGEISGDWSGGPDTTAVTIGGWTTDSTRFIKLYTLSDARHSGKWDTNAHILKVTGGTTNLDVRQNYTEVRDIQAQKDSPSGGGTGFRLQATDLICERCITRLTNPGASASCEGYLTFGSTLKVINCIAYDYDTDSTHYGFLNLGGTLACYNCTMQNCHHGYGESGTTTVKNCIAQDCTDGFNGSFEAASDYNCSDIASDAPGGNSVTGTVTFKDKAGDDFHLDGSDTVALNAGTDLSGDATYAFSTDIDQNERTGTWDIGADEFLFAPIFVASYRKRRV